MHRRRFLQAAGCALCAAGAHHPLLRGSDARAAEAFTRLDAAAQLNLADMALDLARRAGAGYADVRIGRREEEFLRARERRLDDLNAIVSVGIGGSEMPDPDPVTRLVALAVENARASHLIQATPIVLEDIPAYQADWRMPMKVDPFAISTQDKAERLLAINDAALKAGADYCTSLMGFVREQKLFA